MSIKRAEIEDLPTVVQKFKETYARLYQEGTCCHYLLYEGEELVAIGGAVIKEDVPFCFFKTPYYGYVMDVYCIPEKRRQGYAT